MGFFDKKPSFSALKGAVAEAATKLSDTAKGVDVQAMVNQARELANSTADQAVDLSRTLSDKAVTGGLSLTKSAIDTLEGVDTTVLTQPDFYRARYLKYQEITATKLTALYKSTFELDREALDMVEGLKAQRPAPAPTADEIFERCRQEALRRALSAFALGGVMADIDQHSAAKYANLSHSYGDYKDEIDYAGQAHPNYAAMSNQRAALPMLGMVENGYNRADPLYGPDADVEHVVSRKQIYGDGLLRIGTTDTQMADIMNDPRNLIFANGSLNGSKGEKDLMAYLGEYGRQDPSDPDRIIVTIKTTKQEVPVSRADAEAAYEQAQASLRSHRLEAAKEVGATLVKTGATMAAQQVVGLIVLETADIFVDETKALVLREGALDEAWSAEHLQCVSARIQTRLSDRFEERGIWQRAKQLGMEAGVAGALSALPQILVSMLVKLPAFVLGLIRECTLSVVRCVRILRSEIEDKFGGIQVVLASAASAVAGMYLGRILSTAFAGLPVLGSFAPAISDVLAGVLVAALPLAAIYAFERYKDQWTFSMKAPQPGLAPAA